MELFSQTIKTQKDILAVRDRSRVICEELGFGVPQQLQVTTSVFELGKNILAHAGEGTIVLSILTEGDTPSLQIEGVDQGKGMDEETIKELLESKSSTKVLRGIPAMKRLMDEIEIESDPEHGTTIRMIKRRSEAAKSIAKNIVNFLQEKFSSRKRTTLSEEVNQQNTYLAQTLSLYEEKNQELEKTNQKLMELKKELEVSNAELQERSTELQEALLSLGDRTTELESQNRHFASVLKVMKEGVVITNRSGVVTVVNDCFCQWFNARPEDWISKKSHEWWLFLGKNKTVSDEEWNKLLDDMEKNPSETFTFRLHLPATDQGLECRVLPILNGDKKFYGRLWIFS